MKPGLRGPPVPGTASVIYAQKFSAVPLVLPNTLPASRRSPSWDCQTLCGCLHCLCSCSRKRAAPGDATFEMVDVGRLEVWTCGLIVAAILVQPGNWIRVGATVRRHRLLSGQRKIPRIRREWKYCQRGARFQHFSATVVLAPQTHRCTPISE